MEEEFILGKMEEDMKEIINMIKSMVMVHIIGLMVENMRDIGNMENSMEEENIIYPMEQ